MAWFKTFRKQKHDAMNRSGLEYSKTDQVEEDHFMAKHTHQYTPDVKDRKGTIHRERAIMGYEDTVRAARKHHVDSSPVFVESVKGKIFMTDYTETIRIYNTNGKRLPSVHAESQHSMLSGMAINSTEKSLFVCDAHAKGQARVQIFNIADDITPVVYLGHGLFQAPHGITVTDDNRTLVTDVERKEVFIIQDDGYNALCFGGPGRRPGQFSFPHDVIYDAQHRRVVVSDTHNHRLQVFNDQGQFLEVIEFDANGSRLFNYPTGMKLDPVGNLLVCENGSDSLKILDKDYRPFRTLSMSSMGLKNPTSVAVLPYERLCVSSREQSCIVIF